MNPARLKVGLIGYGYAGRTFHAPLIAATEGLTVATVAVRGGQAAPAAPAPPRVATATVVRTNLVTTALTGGTLGYAPARPVLNLVTGIYTWLPLGLRVVHKVEAVVRQEMNRAGAIELSMPVVQPAELWQESGRWDKYGAQLLRFTQTVMTSASSCRISRLCE